MSVAKLEEIKRKKHTRKFFAKMNFISSVEILYTSSIYFTFFLSKPQDLTGSYIPKLINLKTDFFLVQKMVVVSFCGPRVIQALSILNFTFANPSNDEANLQFIFTQKFYFF